MPITLFFIVTGLCSALSVLAAWRAELLLTMPVSVVSDVVQLRLAHNAGIAFGLQLPVGIQEAFIAVALLAVCVLALRAKDTLSSVAYGLIAGGGIGNVLDRMQDGLVTDFVQIGSFPVFNLADTFITVGAILLIFMQIPGWMAHKKVPIQGE